MKAWLICENFLHVFVLYYFSKTILNDEWFINRARSSFSSLTMPEVPAKQDGRCTDSLPG